MWKPLTMGYEVLLGDVVRFMQAIESPKKTIEETLYEVVKADQHYFEIIPKEKQGLSEPMKKIIKYMDIGYYVQLEVWKAVS